MVPNRGTHHIWKNTQNQIFSNSKNADKMQLLILQLIYWTVKTFMLLIISTKGACNLEVTFEDVRSCRNWNTFVFINNTFNILKEKQVIFLRQNHILVLELSQLIEKKCLHIFTVYWGLAYPLKLIMIPQLIF